MIAAMVQNKHLISTCLPNGIHLHTQLLSPKVFSGLVNHTLGAKLLYLHRHCPISYTLRKKWPKLHIH